jgi:peptidoglycan/LPS O-acetylase OafA/YrhL
VGTRTTTEHRAGGEPLAPGAHLPELDGLRGIAVLMVLLLHTRPTLFFWGWAGVDLFLVLSGFLITRILLENRGQPGMLWAFYGRRALRIWPVYYLTLAVTAVLLVTTAPAGTPSAVPGGHWMSLVFLQNTEHYLPGAATFGYIWFFEHSWSVAVEEQFYLIWPLLLVGLALRPSRLLVLGLAALCAALLARTQGMSLHLLLTRVDGLILGAAVAFLATSPAQTLQRMPRRFIAYAAAAGAALVLPYLWLGTLDRDAAFGPRAGAVLGFALVFAAALCAVLRSIGRPQLRWLRLPALRWVGKISFGLYMYHVPIGYLGLLGVHHGVFGLVTAKLVMCVGSLLAAHLSYQLFEKRILALKRALPYQGRPSAAADRNGAVSDLEFRGDV